MGPLGSLASLRRTAWTGKKQIGLDTALVPGAGLVPVLVS